MKKQGIVICSFVLLVLSHSFSFSQDERPNSSFRIAASGGICSFMGDMGHGYNIQSISRMPAGYSLTFEGRFLHQVLGVSLNGMFGKLAMGERSLSPDRNKNFESRLISGGLNFTLYLRNKTTVAPYLTAGFSYAMLDTKTDIKFRGDSLYHFWKDGTIRNLPEDGNNKSYPRKISRDYVYESPLAGAVKSAMTIPLGIGFEFKVGTRMDVSIGSTYHLSMTDGIDAMKGGMNDAFIFSYATVGFNIFKKSAKKPEEEPAKTNLAALPIPDSDKDGVPDWQDSCKATPRVAKVDTKGCPVDTDGDQVPDYLDKELNSLKGATVDSLGIATTTPKNNEKAAKKDSLIKSFQAKPSGTQAKKIDKEIKSRVIASNKTSKVPEKFKDADSNSDDIISSTEIIAVIERFFEGSNNYSAEKIHSLIDYFFEQ